MNLRKTISAALVTVFLSAFAGLTEAGAQEFGQRRYSVEVNGIYGYNGTWQHHGGAGVRAFLPVHKFVHMEAGVEALSTNAYGSYVTLRPVFAVGTGEIFADATLNFRPFACYGDYDLTAAVSVGYRRDYVSVQLGLFDKWMGTMGTDKSTVLEPYCMMYRVRACVRPGQSRWNIGGGVTNFTGYEFERMWQPIFFVDAHYDVLEHLRVQASVFIKPAGIFHQVASFESAKVKAGLTYIF